MATDSTGNYCAEHDRHYGKLEQCAGCRAALASTVATVSPKADTSNVRAIAARYRLNELACWAQCQATMIDEGNVATKWSAESGKWASRADELEMRILELEHDQWLVEQDKLRKGGGS